MPGSTLLSRCAFAEPETISPVLHTQHTSLLTGAWVCNSHAYQRWGHLQAGVNAVLLKSVLLVIKHCTWGLQCWSVLVHSDNMQAQKASQAAVVGGLPRLDGHQLTSQRGSETGSWFLTNRAVFQQHLSPISSPVPPHRQHTLPWVSNQAGRITPMLSTWKAL